jgi:hypothetical protein
MLEEAVNEKRGIKEPESEVPEVEVDLNLDAYFHLQLLLTFDCTNQIQLYQ